MTAKKTKFKTKGEARVAIAKDVLAWIDTAEIYVAQSEYVYSYELISRKDINENTDLRKKLKKQRKEKACQVCALGAAFLVAVDRFNEVGCNDVISMSTFENISTDENAGYVSRIPRNSVTGYLQKFFTSKQIDLIEVAFERTTSVLGDTDCSSGELMKAIDFGYKSDFPKQRLESIMNNIVDNKGTFVP